MGAHLQRPYSAVTNTASNLFNPLYDIQMLGKVPAQEERRQIQANFKRLSTLVQSSTLNVVNLTPGLGFIIVGNGSTFVTIPPGAPGTVLTVDPDSPVDLSFKDPNVIFQTDQIRRLLELTNLELEAILGLLRDQPAPFTPFSETPVGTIDGTNATFYLTHAPVGFFQLFLNGALQNPLGNDFTLTGNTIVYTSAPLVNSVHAAFYFLQANPS